MAKKTIFLMVVSIFIMSSAVCSHAADRKFHGIKFPEHRVIEGKTLTLNGVALRKAMIFIKVFAGGLYLEHPTKNAKQAIESEQVKYYDLHYLTNLATAKKIQKGFIDEMEKTNPPALVNKHRAEIKQYADWLNQDMKKGSVSESIYIPGKGLTLILNGVVKGTIKDKEFARMYYTYSLGEKADKKLRKGYLGL